MRYDVSIIIVNFNGKKYIQTLFESLLRLKTESISYEIIFVDNNSNDDSVVFLEDNYRHNFKEALKIISAKQNLGFAGGNNFGVENASGDYVVFLNNDTSVDEHWLSNLYHAIEQNKAGIVTSKLLFYYDFVKVSFFTVDKIIISNKLLINGIEYKIDPKFCKNLIYNDDSIICFGNSYLYLPLLSGLNDHQILFTVLNSETSDEFEICGIRQNFDINGNNSTCVSTNQVQENTVTLIQNAGSGIDANYNGFDLGFCQEDENQFNEYRPVQCACGAAMIIKKSDFEQVGSFDQEFFMYYEDADLSLRIKNRLGKEILYCPDAIVRHFHTGSSKEWSPFFIYYVFRNRLLFILKNYRYIDFCKQFIKFNLHNLKMIFGRTQPEIKRAKLKALISVYSLTPKYLLNKK